MTNFHYTLSSISGTHQEGEISASNREIALRKLRKKDQIIISLEEIKKSRTWFWQKPKLSLEEKLLFTSYMATMIKVGITIKEALHIIMSQTKKEKNREMYKKIIEMIQNGQSLALSLKQYDFIFSELFINMIASGEESGNLAQILEYLAVQLEKEYDLRKKIISAFIYPAVIISITMLLAVGMVIFIMPRITKIFISLKVKLPLPTRVLIGFSNLLTHQPYIVIFGVIIFIVTIKAILKAKSLRPSLERTVFHIPVFGRLLVYANLARISRLLHSLLQTGIPITRGLDIIGNTLSSTMYKKIIYESRDKVEQGGRLGESFDGNEKLFPQLMTKMLFIGEKTGSLELTTEHLAEMYEKNVDNLTKNLSVLLEPLLLVFMGALVGGIALSIILPIYQLPNLISR
ncbi:type II secretion system F family protein [Candidatus Peregrinibacteria bacterium]|nr:type II secretion system F family protein [Candidatus Peregrinibacteria bacterium]